MKNFLRITLARLGIVVWSFVVVPAMTTDNTAAMLLGMPAGALAGLWLLNGWER